MHAAKINGQVHLVFRYFNMQVIQITEQIPEPYRNIQFTAAAGLHTRGIAIFAKMNGRQSSPGSHPVLKIQCPHNSTINLYCIYETCRFTMEAKIPFCFNSSSKVPLSATRP